jgi:hypothetical protein
VLVLNQDYLDALARKHADRRRIDSRRQHLLGATLQQGDATPPLALCRIHGAATRTARSLPMANRPRTGGLATQFAPRISAPIVGSNESYETVVLGEKVVGQGSAAERLDELGDSWQTTLCRRRLVHAIVGIYVGIGVSQRKNTQGKQRDNHPVQRRPGAVTRYAKLAPLVIVRPVELRQADWTKFSLADGEWRIPAKKMKMRRPHRPLASQALAILRELQKITGGSDISSRR